jgi:hypothetical protein
LLPKRQLTFQIGDLLFRIGDLFIAFDQFLAQPLDLAD